MCKQILAACCGKTEHSLDASSDLDNLIHLIARIPDGNSRTVIFMKNERNGG